MIKIELNADLYDGPDSFFKSISAPSTSRIYIVVHNKNEAHYIRKELTRYCEDHGFIHKVILMDNRIETVFGNIWIITQDTCVEKVVGLHGVQLYITQFALEKLQIGSIKYLNSRTIPCLSKSDVRIADLPSVT